MEMVSNTDEVNKILASGYTRGMHSWRGGRAAVQAVESVRD